MVNLQNIKVKMHVSNNREGYKMTRWFVILGCLMTPVLGLSQEGELVSLIPGVWEACPIYS